MSQQKDPELLEIPGTEGAEGDPNIAAQHFINQMTAAAPTQQIPLLQIAGMSAAEMMTQELLKKFLGTSATEGEGYKLGMGELKKTLGGEYYDPRTSDFWKGFREVSAMEQEKGVADIRRRGQLGGGLYAEPGMRHEAEYVRGAGAERQMMLGGLYEKERERKAAGIGQALGYAGFEETGKLSRLQAGSTIGALPRQLEQARYGAEHAQALGQTGADYASQIAEIGIQSGAAQQLMPQWSIPGQQADPLGGILGLISTFASIGK